MRRGESGLSLLLAIDKPIGPTSHDVVNHVRHALGERRVGHAGTLDPAASGVMVVGVGAATRLLTFLSADRKAYVARIAFGFETTTDDATGERTVLAKVPGELSDHDFAARELSTLVGVHDQVPPSFSAAHVAGKRAYVVARAGERPELSSRRVEVFSASLLAVEPTSDGAVAWICAFEVSKGTYIRAIARDLGRALGSAAHLSELRRTASGGVGVAQCLSLDDVAELGVMGVARHALDPLAALGMARRDLSAPELVDVSCGRRLACGMVMDGHHRRPPAQGERLGLSRDGFLYGVWECRDGGLVCVCNLPDGVAGVRG